jgi:hypothetical protein
MAKGPEKNTKNKALHTKLLNQKKAKAQEEKKSKSNTLEGVGYKNEREKE